MDAEGIKPVRAIILLVPRESVFAYLTGQRVLSNVPADATLRSMWIDLRSSGFYGRHYLALRMEHPSFKPIRRTLRIPFVKARFRKVAPE